MRYAAVLVVLSMLGGCGVPRIPGITPYKPEIQQGNYVSPELIAQVKPGMTREQVRFLLGTPLLVDIFHNDRWDYIYTRETTDGRREKRRVALFFVDDKVARMEGDVGSPAAGR